MKLINQIEEQRKWNKYKDEFLTFFTNKLDKLNLKYDYWSGSWTYKYILYQKDKWYHFRNTIAGIHNDLGRIDLFGECHLEDFKEAIKEWETLHKGKITLVVLNDENQMKGRKKYERTYAKNYTEYTWKEK